MIPATLSPMEKPLIISFLIPKSEPWDISSYDLMKFMGQQESDAATAEKACLELYRRFAPQLLAMARRWEYLGAKYDGELLVSETLLRAYRKPNTIKCPPQPNREMEDKKVLGWLFGILKFLIIDYTKIKWSQTKDIVEALAKAREYFRRNVPEPWYYYARDFIRELSRVDADILLTSYNYYDFTRRVCDVPSDVRNALCRKHKISQGNLRTRRTRLVQSLLDFVSEKAILPSAALV